jgi:hypothetical protein
MLLGIPLGIAACKLLLDRKSHVGACQALCHLADDGPMPPNVERYTS